MESCNSKLLCNCVVNKQIYIKGSSVVNKQIYIKDTGSVINRSNSA